MPPPNIIINADLSSNDYTVPAGINIVTFHSAVACTICFQHAPTFGITSLNIAANILVTLTLSSRLETAFEPVALGTPCTLTQSQAAGLAVHTIGMDSGLSSNR